MYKYVEGTVSGWLQHTYVPCFLFFRVGVIAFSETLLVQPLHSLWILCLRAFHTAPVPPRLLLPPHPSPYQSKDGIVARQAPSTVLHIYRIMLQNTDNVVGYSHKTVIRFQAGTGGWRINLVSFLFLACCCYTPGATQRISSFPPECVLLVEKKHFILWVADYLQ